MVVPDSSTTQGADGAEGSLNGAETHESRTSLTGPSNHWFTDEMASIASAAYDDDGRAWTQERMWSALEAIAPMVEKLVAEKADGLEQLLQAQREHDRHTEGWDAGYRQGFHDGLQVLS